MDVNNPRRTTASSTELVVTMTALPELLGVGRTTAFSLVRSGQLKSFKIGRRRLVPRTAIEEFIKAQCEESVLW